MATTFGLDISHHQGAFDFARAKREGIAFVILKATEGSEFIDNRFVLNLAAARKAGVMVAAYHYQRANASAAAQVAHIREVVPKDVPVIPDVEAGSGPVSLTRDLVTKLRAAGYTVPLSYIPRWYWQQIGSPSLAGLPPLWSSRYPDNVVGSIADEFADVPASFWDGYGGLPVKLLQFTSSAAIAGRSPIDANAFRGTAAQFAALLGDAPEEDDVKFDDAFDPEVWNDRPGTLGHFLVNQGQDNDAVRLYTDTVEPQLAAARSDIAALAKKVDGLAVGGGSIDYAQLAKAINDDADARRRDGDPATGPAS